MVVENVKFTLKQARKAQSGGIALLFNLDAGWRWVVNAMPRPLYPQERRGTHCVGEYVGPRASLEGCWKSRLH